MALPTDFPTEMFVTNTYVSSSATHIKFTSLRASLGVNKTEFNSQFIVTFLTIVMII